MSSSIPTESISTMSYRTLLRSLPVIEQADVDSTTLGRVAARLVDPAEVAASGLSPLRLWSALRHSGTFLFAPELERALQLSLASVAPLAGRSLVLLDSSGSMNEPLVAHEGVRAFEIGAVFAATVADAARRGGGVVDVVLYASDAVPHALSPSVAGTVDAIASRIGEVGHVSDAGAAGRRWFDGHDRVFVFSDEADALADLAAGDRPRWSCPVYGWDLRGRGGPRLDHRLGRYAFFGFADAHVRLLPVLEQQHQSFRPNPRGHPLAS